MRKARRVGRGRASGAGAVALPENERGARIAPTAERLRQGPVEVTDTPVKGRVFRCLDVLDVLERNGAIDADHVSAGRRFQKAFHQATLDPLRTGDLGRLPGGGHGVTVAVMEARALVYEAIAALGGFGSLSAQAMWWVVGCGDSVSQWAGRASNGRSAAIHRLVAKGIVISALGTLAGHYRANGKARKSAVV